MAKAKFHYASWFEAGSKLVVRTSFEPASVIEFAFKTSLALVVLLLLDGLFVNRTRFRSVRTVAVNSVFGKVGRIASDEVVILHLVKYKCMFIRSTVLRC